MLFTDTKYFLILDFNPHFTDLVSFVNRKTKVNAFCTLKIIEDSICLFYILYYIIKIKYKILLKGRGGQVKIGVMCSSPRWGHDHYSSYDTSTGWFQEVDSRVIYLSC